jgi:hypothetical protein
MYVTVAWVCIYVTVLDGWMHIHTHILDGCSMYVAYIHTSVHTPTHTYHTHTHTHTHCAAIRDARGGVLASSGWTACMPPTYIHPYIRLHTLTIYTHTLTIHTHTHTYTHTAHTYHIHTHTLRSYTWCPWRSPGFERSSCMYAAAMHTSVHTPTHIPYTHTHTHTLSGCTSGYLFRAIELHACRLHTYIRTYAYTHLPYIHTHTAQLYLMLMAGYWFRAVELHVCVLEHVESKLCSLNEAQEMVSWCMYEYVCLCACM